MTEPSTRLTSIDLAIIEHYAYTLRFKFEAAGIEVFDGPRLRRPGLFDPFRARDRDLCRRLNSVGLYLTDEGRIRYHVQRNDGQGYDDGTGYWLRCWAAAFSFPFKPAWISASSIPQESASNG